MKQSATTASETAMTLRIERVEGHKALQQFIDFPHDLYAGDPNYVPELFMSQEALLNRAKSPFFLHSKAEYYLANWNA